MSPTLQVRFLGESQFIYDGEVVTGLHTKRMRSLLGYLFLHAGQQLAATHLAFLYWPDSSEKQAKTNLRRLFYNLRQAFPESERFLSRQDHTVLWRTDAPYTLDVANFKDAIDAVRSPAIAKNDAETCAQLEAAIALYRGDLLPDCYDDWILPLREELRQRYLDAIEQLVELLEANGDYKRAIRYADVALREDPLLERPYRVLMRLHSLNGDRARALRVYHVCASVLERELGVEPHAKTTALYQRLLHADESDRNDEAPKIGYVGENRQLVGRRNERKRLLAAWRAASRGETSFVLISGEAGIGKTRLAEELHHWVTQLGIDAAHTRTYPASTGLAYAPVIDWLRSAPLTSRLQSLEPIWLTELARLLPDLLTIHSEIPPPQPMAETWSQHRLFEALARVVFMGKQPLLLWIDDIQWCDGESLAWLQYLVQFDRRAPLLILGTMRNEEVDPGDPLTSLVHHLRALERLTEIELARLSLEETTQLGRQVAGAELSDSMIGRLSQDADGNPLFVVEMARAAVDATHGAYPQRKEPASAYGRVGERSGGGGRMQVSLPSKVYSVIQSRLGQLSPSARTLAGLAATIGSSFTFDILAQACDMDESQLVQSLDELWRRRIVSERSTTPSNYAYDFSHNRIRDVAYDELSATYRRFYHRAVAGALERTYADRLDEWSARIALHYDRARSPDQARRYYSVAGRWAADQFAHDEALHYLTRALELTDPEDANARFDLHSQCERIRHVQTARDAQQQELDAMAALAEQSGQQDKRGVVLLRRAARAEGMGAYDEAVVFARRAIDHAQASGHRRQEAEGALRLGSVFWNWGDYLRSGEQYQQGLEIARAIGERRLEAVALLHLGALEVYCGDYHEAQGISREALDAACALADPRGEIWARNQLGFVIVEQGDDDYDEAETHLVKGLELARKIGDRAYIAKLSNNLAMLYDRQGAFDQAMIRLDESQAIARETGSARHMAFALNYRANVLANQRQWTSALTHYEQALALFREIGYRQGEGKTSSELALLSIWTNDPEGALGFAEQALAIAQEIGVRRDQAYALTRRGYALEGMASFDRARDAYERALAIYAVTGQRNRALEPTAGLARIARVQGDHDHAHALIDSIVQRLQTHSTDATNEALWVHYTCKCIVDAGGDSPSVGLSAKNRQLLSERAPNQDDSIPSIAFETPLREFGTFLQRSPR